MKKVRKPTGQFSGLATYGSEETPAAIEFSPAIATITGSERPAGLPSNMQSNGPQSVSAPPGKREDFVSRLSEAHDKLLGYLLSLLGRWHDAQDVLQRSSLLMWQKFDTFEPESDFLAWASTICFYEAKNFRRLAARSPLHFDDDLLATLAAERLNDLELQSRRFAALELCLHKVAASDRALLSAAYTRHGDISRLASTLRRAPRTLYNKLTALRRRLAECVERRLAEGMA